jgi:hypothetical protein
LISLAIYRLYFSSIAWFPGLKLVALTLWCELYHDIFMSSIERLRPIDLANSLAIQPGCSSQWQYTWQIKPKYKRYGPIIRIRLTNGPEFYGELYAGASVRKTHRSDHTFDGPNASFGTAQHD